MVISWECFGQFVIKSKIWNNVYKMCILIRSALPRYGERGGLVVNASDSGSRGRRFEPHWVKPCSVLEQGTFTPKKVLIIPRKRWLRPNMTEKLFTGTLRINQPTNQPYPDVSNEYPQLFHDGLTNIIIQLSLNVLY